MYYVKEVNRTENLITISSTDGESDLELELSEVESLPEDLEVKGIASSKFAYSVCKLFQKQLQLLPDNTALTAEGEVMFFKPSKKTRDFLANFVGRTEGRSIFINPYDDENVTVFEEKMAECIFAHC